MIKIVDNTLFIERFADTDHRHWATVPVDGFGKPVWEKVPEPARSLLKPDYDAHIKAGRAIPKEISPEPIVYETVDPIRELSDRLDELIIVVNGIVAKN